tara:strand:+ start:11316 stop:11966 length:651 start_codon:yes stop_codon:yes gene_type:complete
MLRKVYLNGELGEKYGKVAEVKAETVREVIQYLDANYTGVKKYLLDSDKKKIGFTIKVADQHLEHDQELLMPLNKGDIIITPVPLGSRGAVKAFIGAVLIVIGIIVPPLGSILIPIGLSLVSQGLAEMMAPDPATDNDGSEDGEDGYLFQGSEQVIPEGRPVPVLYGELRVPGQPITFDLQNIDDGWNALSNANGAYTLSGDPDGNIYKVAANRRD